MGVFNTLCLDGTLDEWLTGVDDAGMPNACADGGWAGMSAGELVCVFTYITILLSLGDLAIETGILTQSHSEMFWSYRQTMIYYAADALVHKIVVDLSRMVRVCLTSPTPKKRAIEGEKLSEVPVAVYVDDSALAQAGPKAVPSLRKMVNMTGFMYYFLGLERRAKKCLWIRLVWCLGVLTRMKERAAEVLACDAWTVDWATDSPVILSAKPVRVVEMIMTVSFVISATLRHSRPARGPPRGRSRNSLAALSRCSQRSLTCVTVALAS